MNFKTGLPQRTLDGVTKLFPGLRIGEDGRPVRLRQDTADLFTKMIRESYMPSPVEIMSGQVKSNDVSLLATFQQAFDLR